VKRKRTKRKHGFYRGIFFGKPFLTELTPLDQKKPQAKKWRCAGFPLICLSILALKAYPAFSGINWPWLDLVELPAQMKFDRTLV